MGEKYVQHISGLGSRYKLIGGMADALQPQWVDEPVHLDPSRSTAILHTIAIHLTLPPDYRFKVLEIERLVK